jgi:hypothetical protein
MTICSAGFCTSDEYDAAKEPAALMRKLGCDLQAGWSRPHVGDRAGALLHQHQYRRRLETSADESSNACAFTRELAGRGRALPGEIAVARGFAFVDLSVLGMQGRDCCFLLRSNCVGRLCNCWVHGGTDKDSSLLGTDRKRDQAAWGCCSAMVATAEKLSSFSSEPLLGQTRQKITDCSAISPQSRNHQLGP